MGLQMLLECTQLCVGPSAWYKGIGLGKYTKPRLCRQSYVFLCQSTYWFGIVYFSVYRPHPCQYSYSIIIFDVPISFVVNKRFHCVHMTSFSCNVQRSPLSGKIMTAANAILIKVKSQMSYNICIWFVFSFHGDTYQTPSPLDFNHLL